MEKPKKGLGILYNEARREMTEAVNGVVTKHRLPLYMFDGILSGIMSEMRINEINQVSADYSFYSSEVESYCNKIAQKDSEGAE